MTPFGEEWILVKDRIQTDFKRTRKDYKWIEPLLASLTKKEKQLNLYEAQEYLEECLCAYTEGLVLRLAKKKDFYVWDYGTTEYFFEELWDVRDDYYPMKFKLEDFGYDMEARNALRKQMLQQSISQTGYLGEMLDEEEEPNSIEPLHDFLQILIQNKVKPYNLLNENGLPSEMDVHLFVNSLQNSFEVLCSRISVKSHELKSD